MDFKKFLEMANDAIVEAKKKESTAEKDHKAEKAGKKVAKDIEYDEGHKGKDDDKAEKAGKKVTKDIEYDDKKDKKKSLKDWFEIVEKNKLNETSTIGMKPVPVMDPKTNKPAGAGVITSTSPELHKMLQTLDPKKVQVVMTTQASQPKTGQTGLTAGGGASSIAATEGAEDNPPSTEDGDLLEKWAGDAEVKATGEYSGKTVEQLKSMLAKLHKSGPHKAGSPEAKKQRQINFALRAKGGWKKGEGAAMKEAALNEKAPPGMEKWIKDRKAAFKKQYGDRWEEVLYATAWKEKNKKKTNEAERPSDQADFGAGLGAGRSDKVLETKQVNESMNTLEAAYHEGKSHGLSKHGYACRYNEGSEEHRRYHEGFKEGLDECYGLMPNRGLVVGETDMPAATVPGMASQAMPAMEADLDEMNRTEYMKHKAKTTPGDTFKAFGQTMHDKDVLEDNFAFESLDQQLNALLNQDHVVVNEGISVNMSQGLGGPGAEDSVSVTAQGDDAKKLLDFIKQVGLGGLGADKAEVTSLAEPAVAVVSDYGAPKFAGHDDMKSLLSKVTGDGYKDEEDHEHDHSDSVCNECGMNETKCACDEEKVVDETQTPDQMTDEMAEDSAGADEVAMTTADEDAEAAEDATKPAKGGAVTEGGDGMEDSAGAADAVKAGADAEEAEEEMNESEKLDEWANDAGKDGTEQSFERDIEFMTKVIAGGLNKPKVTGQTTIPVIASQDARNGDEDVTAWKRLAGISK